MTAKEYLMQVSRAERELKTLRAQLDHYEDIGLLITPSISHTGGSGQRGASRVEAAAVGMIDTLAEIRERIAEYTAITAAARATIDKIPQERYRRILILRYLCGWSWSSISDELMYNDRNSVYRAHGYALTALKKVM